MTFCYHISRPRVTECIMLTQIFNNTVLLSGCVGTKLSTLWVTATLIKSSNHVNLCTVHMYKTV